MRVGHLNVTRPPWYDRTSTISSSNFTATAITPHATTVRSTYTVPSGVRTYIDCLSLNLNTSSVATTSHSATVQWRYTQSGGAANPIHKISYENQAIFALTSAMAGAGQMRAGDVLEGTTTDNDVGGSLNYSGESKINEYAI